MTPASSHLKGSTPPSHSQTLLTDLVRLMAREAARSDFRLRGSNGVAEEDHD